MLFIKMKLSLGLLVNEESTHIVKEFGLLKKERN